MLIAASKNLTNAITITGEAYEDIGKLYDDQPTLDWERFGDVMHDYRGLLGGWPSVLQVHAVSLFPFCRFPGETFTTLFYFFSGRHGETEGV